MEIDNLTRYMAYASYACDLAKEKALNLKQKALANGGSVGNHTAEGLEFDVYCLDKMRLVFSFAAEQLAQRQKTNVNSADDCGTIEYWSRENYFGYVDYFKKGIFSGAAGQYRTRYFEEKGLHDEASERTVKYFGRFHDLEYLVQEASDFCNLAIEKASELIQEREAVANDREILKLESDNRRYREFQNTFSAISQQLEEEQTPTKESYDKCTEIERVCRDCLSDVQYFNIDVFLLAADEYKRRYDKERSAENSLPEKRTGRFSGLFHFPRSRQRSRI
ncbi:MAG: hypothetical protein IJL92_05970 [Thermoguttaceae bacterium]|nr:hypothetical protein [Thermoguttaceae bacterium]